MACAWAFWLTGPNLHSPGARLHADRRSDPSQGQRTSTEPSAIQRPFCRTEVSFLSVASYLLEAHDSQMCHKGATPDRGKSPDRKSTRLNSSHSQISYAVFCLK